MIAVIKIIVFISISDCLNLPIFSSMNLKKKKKKNIYLIKDFAETHVLY